ncbi:MAG: hypothetical protein GJT30_11805 [Geobacter sp.]|nr:hypothetical protein [Geobacter sp.]
MSTVDPIQSAQTAQMVQDLAHKKLAGTGQSSPQEMKQPGQDSVTVAVPASTKSLERLESVTNELNQVAKQVRATDSALQERHSLISQMKVELNKIVKNYPPFLMDSDERKEILMSYRSLRQFIEKLIVPPPPDPIYKQEKHLWDKLTTQDATTADTPDLTLTASDGQVASALESLGADQAAVENGREALAKTSQL